MPFVIVIKYANVKKAFCLLATTYVSCHNIMVVHVIMTMFANISTRILFVTKVVAKFANAESRISMTKSKESVFYVSEL